MRAMFIYRLAAWGLSVGAALSGAAAAAPLEIVYRGKLDLAEETAVDQHGDMFTIGGLSGITYLGGNSFLAVSDDASASRLLHLEISFDGGGAMAAGSAGGGIKLAENRDFEGIAYTDPVRNSVFLSAETGPGAVQLYEFGLAGGALIQAVDLPAVYSNQIANRGLESLTRRPDGQEMWTANEEALSVDGPLATTAAGTTVRLQRLSAAGGGVTPVEQYAYVTEPIHSHVSLGSEMQRGLVDLVSLPDGSLLALERSAAAGLPPFVTAIYHVDLTGATDVGQGVLADGLAGQSYVPAAKALLFASDALQPTGGNLEGLCLGPQLPGGGYVLLGIVDSGDGFSQNTLVAFEITTVPEPPAAWLILGGGAFLVLISVVWRTIKKARRDAAAKPG